MSPREKTGVLGVFSIDVLKQKRELFGLSLEMLSEMSGISKRHLLRIEQGKQDLTEKLKVKIDDVFELFEQDVKIDVIYDYVKVRFPYFLNDAPEKDQARVHAKQIIEKLFGLRFESWEQRPIKRYYYDGMYSFGDFTVLYPAPDKKEMGILVELKGRGCRQLESVMVEQGRTWKDFFLACYEFAPVFKRLDLAVNDYHGILSVPDMIEKCKAGAYYLNRMRTFSIHMSGVPNRKEIAAEKPPMGHTLYIGAHRDRDSKLYFCIYEKDLEQEAKLGIEPDEAESKNRFEIRVQQERADIVVAEILLRDDMAGIALDIINDYLRFFHTADTPDITCPRWAKFIGVARKKIDFSMKPEPYTLDRTYNWVERSVMPSIKFLAYLEQHYGTVELQDMFARAELSERHQRMFGQLVARAEDIMLPAFLKQSSGPADPGTDADGFRVMDVKPGEKLAMQRMFAGEDIEYPSF